MRVNTILDIYKTVPEDEVTFWYDAASVNDFPKDGGACIKYGNKQIAVFNFAQDGQWYACQNVCPHKLEMVLSRGMIGESDDIPKVACPLHKKTFSLTTGENLNGDLEPIATYPVKVENNRVFIGFAD